MKKLKRVFGEDEFGFAELPQKISGVQISRVLYENERGCSICFPHGFETDNSTAHRNRQRSWKKFRKTQYKIC